MTREQAEAAGWKITCSSRTPRWDGDDELEWWIAELQSPLHREMAESLEHLLEMVEGYDQHRASRGLVGGTVVPIRTGIG
jgi:hypothetical protein